MDTLKTNQGYLHKMVFLCDPSFSLEMNSLNALTLFLGSFVHYHMFV